MVGTLLVAVLAVVTSQAFAMTPPIVDEQGLGAIGDGDELRSIVQTAIDDNPKQAEQLRGGQDKLLGFFVGQVMKATGGRADAKAVNELIRELLGS